MSPAYKNQHYVPQSYLRGWATNEKTTIHLIEQQREVKKQSIDSICSGSYFNSEWVVLERVIAGLEGIHANSMNQVREGKPLRELSTGEQRMLMSFVATQRQRSAVMRDEIADSAEEVLREGIRKDLRETGHDPSEYDEFKDQVFGRVVQETHHFMIMHGVLSPFGMHDLEAVVLKNNSGNPFITSEAPVVFANPRFKHQIDLTYPGMGNHGIQIYCPLSSTRCLLFYDPAAYRVDTDQGWNAIIEDPDDVRELNMLQVFATDSFLIHGESGQSNRMNDLVAESSEYENWEFIDQPIHSTAVDGESRNYPYQPVHQLHDLTPTPDPVHILADVSSGPRKSGIETGRHIVHRILERSDTTEMALIKAVVYMIRDAGLKESAFPTVYN